MKLPRNDTLPRRVSRLYDRRGANLTCRKEIEYIAQYLASELRNVEFMAFEHHLQICPDCAAFLHTYKKTVELTKSFLARPKHRARPLSLPPASTGRRKKRR